MSIEQKFAPMPWRSANLELPLELEYLRCKAKDASRETRFSDAYKYNIDLVAQSHAAGIVRGEVVGLRFAGVCEYRLGHYQESRRLLEEARDLAQAKNLHLQQLHIANHLGATLRRLGDLDAALTTLREALEKVRGPDDLEAKARLLGNLGALYDEIGYEDGADDCYARYEELIELFVSLGDSDDLPRLANARALSARAAQRRGDLTTAKNKHDDELQLALKSKDQLRIRGALFHQAKMHLALGLHEQISGNAAVHFQAAEKAFLKVHLEFDENNESVRSADSWHHRGRLYEAQGRWGDAYAAWKMAWDLGLKTKQLYRQGESSLALARFCQRWALHGESLYWFQEAARIHCQQYLPLKANKRIAKLARARIAELEAVAQKIAEEVRSVERAEHESKEIGELVKTITGKCISKLADERALVPVHEWQKGMRDASLMRWKELITPEKFAKLSPQSQMDLVSADLLYHSVVDELPRSALLIAIVAERELRERLFVPLHEAFEKSGLKTRSWRGSGRPPAAVDYLCYKSADNVPIGSVFWMLAEIFESTITHEAITFARDMTKPWRAQLMRIRELNEQIDPAGARSKGKRFADLRNIAAHGGEHAAMLDRRMVDAMKLRLFLEGPSILATILDVDLR